MIARGGTDELAILDWNPVPVRCDGCGLLLVGDPVRVWLLVWRDREESLGKVLGVYSTYEKAAGAALEHQYPPTIIGMTLDTAMEVTV